MAPIHTAIRWQAKIDFSTRREVDCIPLNSDSCLPVLHLQAWACGSGHKTKRSRVSQKRRFRGGGSPGRSPPCEPEISHETWHSKTSPLAVKIGSTYGRRSRRALRCSLAPQNGGRIRARISIMRSPATEVELAVLVPSLLDVVFRRRFGLRNTMLLRIPLALAPTSKAVMHKKLPPNDHLLSVDPWPDGDVSAPRCIRGIARHPRGEPPGGTGRHVAQDSRGLRSSYHRPRRLAVDDQGVRSGAGY